MDWKIATGKRSVRVRPGTIVVLRDWSNLPSDLVESILQKLDFNFFDVIQFGAVCKRWHNITTERPPNSVPQVPWVLLSSPDTTIDSPFRFLDTSNNKKYSLPPPPYDDDAITTSSGSSRSNIGWFFMFENDTKCSFVNPLTKQQIVLPPTRRSYFLPQSRLDFTSKYRGQSMKSLIRKAVFSSPPDEDEDCLVMAITRSLLHPLLFCKVGDKEWRGVMEHRYSSYEFYQDVIYFKGQFYAVDSYCRVVVCNLNGSSPVTQRISAPFTSRADYTFLVDVSGVLMFISVVKEEGTEDAEYSLFRQNAFGEEWTRVEDRGDQAIFLGFNHSLSVLASNYPGIDATEIYCTDLDHYQQYDDPRNTVLGDSTTKNPVWFITSL